MKRESAEGTVLSGIESARISRKKEEKLRMAAEVQTAAKARHDEQQMKNYHQQEVAQHKKAATDDLKAQAVLEASRLDRQAEKAVNQMTAAERLAHQACCEAPVYSTGPSCGAISEINAMLAQRGTAAGTDAILAANARYSVQRAEMVAREARKALEARRAAQSDQIKAAFTAIDFNSTGSIDVDEFYTIGKLVFGEEEESWTYTKCQSIFGLIDTDCDQSIGEDEFTTYLKQVTVDMDDAEFDEMVEYYMDMGLKAQEEFARTHQGQGEAKSAEKAERILQAFRVMDLDGNRTIDFDEFFEVGKLVRGGEGWTEELCRSVFDMIDTDNDGWIDEAEFTAYLQEMSKEMDDEEFDEMIESYLQMGEQALRSRSSHAKSLSELQSSKCLDKAKQIQEAFRAMDLDGSAGIDADEFYNVGKLVFDSAENIWTKKKSRGVFSMLDTNGDELIDEAEFTAYLEQMSRELCNAELREMLSKYTLMGQQARLAKEVQRDDMLDQHKERAKQTESVGVPKVPTLPTALPDGETWVAELDSKNQELFNLQEQMLKSPRGERKAMRKKISKLDNQIGELHAEFARSKSPHRLPHRSPDSEPVKKHADEVEESRSPPADQPTKNSTDFFNNLTGRTAELAADGVAGAPGDQPRKSSTDFFNNLTGRTAELAADVEAGAPHHRQVSC